MTLDENACIEQVVSKEMLENHCSTFKERTNLVYFHLEETLKKRAANLKNNV